MFRNLPVICSGIAAVAGYTTIHRHLFGCDSYHKKLSYYEEEERPFDENTQKIIDELTDYFLDTVDLHPANVARMKFFWSNMKDATHFGTHFSRFGSFIGVPVTFGYQSRSDVDLTSVNVSDMPLSEEDLEATEQLIEALVMSERAKRFAMATELHALNTWYIILKLQFMCCILGAYYNGFVLSPYMTKKSSAVQLVFLFALIILWYGIYNVSDSNYSISRTLKADKKTAEMGEDYIQGGIEYLTKLQQRNKALRTLQTDGQQCYTEKGERIKRLFEIPSASLSLRLKRLEQLKLQNEDKFKTAETMPETAKAKETMPESAKTKKKYEQVVKEVMEEKAIILEPENQNDQGFFRKILKVFV